MTFKSHFGCLAAALLSLAMIAPNPALAGVNCDEKPNHPKCGGGDDGGGNGNEKLPLTIAFGPLGTGITSDGFGDYVDDPDGTGVEAFVGSAAKTGEILLRLHDIGASRWINLAFGPLDLRDLGKIDDSCGLPPDGAVDELRFLLVKVTDALDKGVYDMHDDADGGPSEVDVSMKLRFHKGDVNNNPQAWVLNYGTGDNKLCGSSTHGSDLVWVIKAVDAEQWTVGTYDSGGAPTGSTACLEKAASGPGDKNKFCGRYEMSVSFTATAN